MLHVIGSVNFNKKLSHRNLFLLLVSIIYQNKSVFVLGDKTREESNKTESTAKSVVASY